MYSINKIKNNNRDDSSGRNSFTLSLMAILSALVFLSTPTPLKASWNNPYSTTSVESADEMVLYSSFSGRPKHLDPVRSYSSNEYAFIGQIYEPPLQYHYLKRPYQLEPLSAVEMPKVKYVDSAGVELAGPVVSSADIAYSIYEINVRSDIQYQPHPAFISEQRSMDSESLARVEQLIDFSEQGSRYLTAADYVYQIKRLAHPSLHSPIYGIMTEHIEGLAELRTELKSTVSTNNSEWLDLRNFNASGVELVDKYTYRVKIKGKYPQFLYWLAMPFFAPMPWEADQFYAQSELKDNSITLDWYPVGTGPFMLTVNNPNRKMVLERNPNYHRDYYPVEGEDGDSAAGLLEDAGREIPFLERIEFSLEKESIPYWSKFLQGYYDSSGISSDSFDQAVKFSSAGDAELSDEMLKQGMRLQTSISTSISYMGFNMADEVVGGASERARKLRQALSIAVDYEEYISIFANGRGIPAQSPIPAGIFGHTSGKDGINSTVYSWKDGKAERRSIAEAKQLLVEAGYPEGRSSETGKPLTLYFDVTGSGPDDRARMDWYRKQFEKIDLQMVVRNTDYNRFQDKMRSGSAQIYLWGWNADYPDPENFLFLLYGPNAKMDGGGENASNYSNPKFDLLFDQMKNMENSLERQQIINQMIILLQADSPWLWGFHPKNFGLYHSWYKNSKPNLMANNTMKYVKIDPIMRSELRNNWNRPMFLPLLLVALFFILLIVPAWLGYRRKERSSLRLR